MATYVCHAVRTAHALRSTKTTQDALKLRPHIKFLKGDYLTAERMALDQGTSPQCRLCTAPIESTEHVLTQLIYKDNFYQNY